MKPEKLSDDITIIHGDCRDIMQTLETESIDAVITDPPYEIGFMGKKWDSTGIANDVEMWKECLRLLKPGGHILSFGGTRTYHRMACAIEDAGFEVRDMISTLYSTNEAFARFFDSLNNEQQKLLGHTTENGMLNWITGSGFPKNLNVGKKVDQIQGNEREDLGKNPNARDGGGNVKIVTKRKDDILTKGNSEWEGWGSAIKPSHEPICMARKPLEKGLTIAENCLKYGTGAINIDACRVEHNDPEKRSKRKSDGKSDYKNPCGWKEVNRTSNRLASANPQGRFPANLILSADENGRVHEEIRECFPETKGDKRKHKITRKDKSNIQFTNRENGDLSSNYNDSGNASRYFKSIKYCPKASKSERGEGNNHPCVKPIELIEYLINLVSREDAVILDPFMGSGTTGVACRRMDRKFIGIEMGDEEFNLARTRLKCELKKKRQGLLF